MWGICGSFYPKAVGFVMSLKPSEFGLSHPGHIFFQNKEAPLGPPDVRIGVNGSVLTLIPTASKP
jgi:hypothetical protein